MIAFATFAKDDWQGFNYLNIASRHFRGLILLTLNN